MKRKIIIDLIEEGFVCAEIGVWRGNFSEQILEKKPSKFHLIDPWKSQDYKERWYSIEQEKMDKIYQSNVDKYGNLDNVMIHRAFSTDVEFPKEYFDFVYIDGNHSYEFVLKDLEHYYKFMKKESFLTGDDYGWTDADCKEGPAKAVKEFCQKHNLIYKVINNQFIIKLGDK